MTRPITRLWACAVLAGACRPPPPAPPAEPPPAVEVVERPCLAKPPPEPGPGIVYADCPGYVACLDESSSRALWLWISDLRTWADDAWLACGPMAAEGGTP